MTRSPIAALAYNLEKCMAPDCYFVNSTDTKLICLIPGHRGDIIAISPEGVVTIEYEERIGRFEFFISAEEFFDLCINGPLSCLALYKYKPFIKQCDTIELVTGVSVFQSQTKSARTRGELPTEEFANIPFEGARISMLNLLWDATPATESLADFS